MTTVNNIYKWLSEAPARSTHMLVVCDTFDYGSYPVYVEDGRPKRKVAFYNNTSMQEVMEVYNLSMNLEEQLKEERAWNTG